MTSCDECDTGVRCIILEYGRQHKLGTEIDKVIDITL